MPYPSLQLLHMFILSQHNWHGLFTFWHKSQPFTDVTPYPGAQLTHLAALAVQFRHVDTLHATQLPLYSPILWTGRHSKQIFGLFVHILQFLLTHATQLLFTRPNPVIHPVQLLRLVLGHDVHLSTLHCSQYPSVKLYPVWQAKQRLLFVEQFVQFFCTHRVHTLFMFGPYPAAHTLHWFDTPHVRHRASVHFIHKPDVILTPKPFVHYAHTDGDVGQRVQLAIVQTLQLDSTVRPVLPPHDVQTR